MNTAKTLLVLEDERPLLEVIKLKLGKSGFDVVTARSVEQALEYLESNVHVDAIWLDHSLLGKENGLDFVTKLKEDGNSWKKIPIFVVSNTASPDMVQSYIKFGVSKYYVKAEHRLDQIIDDISSSLSTASSESAD